MKCPKCNTDQVDNKPFCPSCGNVFPPPPPPPDPKPSQEQTISIFMVILIVILIILLAYTGTLPSLS